MHGLQGQTRLVVLSYAPLGAQVCTQRAHHRPTQARERQGGGQQAALQSGRDDHDDDDQASLLISERSRAAAILIKETRANVTLDAKLARLAEQIDRVDKRCTRHLELRANDSGLSNETNNTNSDQSDDDDENE